MITTNLVELLRDISLRLGILIKTSELPSKQENQPNTYTNQTSLSINSDQQKSSINKPDSSTSNQINDTTNKTDQTQSMSARSMQLGADLLANNNHQSQDYNYIYNKSASCNSTRASIGSVLEQDEVRTVIVTGEFHLYSSSHRNKMKLYANRLINF